ncbi:AIM24 family protein [Verrucomicrobiales bacterium]|nr:AIM24 family protein [Verrucomicrobiales bacterium]
MSGASLSKAEGQDQVYLADAGKKVIIIQLHGEEIIVNGNDLLAFEPSIEYEIKMMKKLGAMLAGGLFNVRLRGTGMIAFTSHYEPITLRVTPDAPVYTDPNATIAWSGNLEPTFKSDISLRTFMGRGGGESFQMEFKGDGLVVIQPFEEIVMANSQGSR